MAAALRMSLAAWILWQTTTTQTLLGTTGVAISHAALSRRTTATSTRPACTLPTRPCTTALATRDSSAQVRTTSTLLVWARPTTASRAPIRTKEWATSCTRMRLFRRASCSRQWRPIKPTTSYACAMMSTANDGCLMATCSCSRLRLASPTSSWLEWILRPAGLRCWKTSMARTAYHRFTSALIEATSRLCPTFGTAKRTLASLPWLAQAWWSSRPAGARWKCLDAPILPRSTSSPKQTLTTVPASRRCSAA